LNYARKKNYSASLPLSPKGVPFCNPFVVGGKKAKSYSE